MIAKECRFGCSDKNPAVGLFKLSAGCLVYPDDIVQALCFHHAMRSTPRGTITLVETVPGLPEWERDALVGRWT